MGIRDKWKSDFDELDDGLDDSDLSDVDDLEDEEEDEFHDGPYAANRILSKL